MKKLVVLGLPMLALVGLAACSPDSDPKIDTSKDFEFVLNTPQLATQFIDLSSKGNIEFTVSQPDYGVTVVPTYGLEISLNPEFTPITEEPVIDSDGEEHIVPGVYALNLDSQLKGVLVAKMSDIASGINQLNGIYEEAAYTEDYVGPLYVRATAYLGYGTAAEATAVVSNVIELTQVQGYPAFTATEIFLSVPGGANDWNHLPQIIYTKDNDKDEMVLQGFAVINGEFKITDGDWDGAGNWGADDTGLIDNGDGTFSATLIQNSQSNFNGAGIAAPGLYYFEVILTDMKNDQDGSTVGTFTITPITSISLPGDYNGWDTTANEMTQDGNFYTWTGEAPVTSAGWKFAMNGEWTINLGGTIDDLIFDGANIWLDGSKVTINLQQYPWTCTVE